MKRRPGCSSSGAWEATSAWTWIARDIDVPGVGTCLLLYEPGDPSPFQAANTYAFTIAAPADASRITATLERTAAGAVTPQPILFQVDPAGRRVTLLVDPDFRSSFRNWYPFHEDDPDAPINLLYGPDRDALPGLLGFELVVQVPADRSTATRWDPAWCRLRCG